MAEPNPNTYTTELEGLRAPLGVILYLIRRDNLDIYDIPIAKITKEYLDYLNMMEDMQIELAGEFFVLAATLMRIKVQMLLRKDDETEEDPRSGLVRSLLEYKKMVEAAKSFREMEEDRAKVFTRPVPDEEKQYREEPTIDLGLFQLVRAFQEVMLHFEAAEVREIELEEWTIEEKIARIEGALENKEQVLFADLFEGVATRMELIVTFMALLELIKHAHIQVRQDQSFGSIWLYRGDNFGQPMDSAGDWESEPIEPVEVKAPVEDVAEQPPPTATDGEAEPAGDGAAGAEADGETPGESDAEVNQPASDAPVEVVTQDGSEEDGRDKSGA